MEFKPTYTSQTRDDPPFDAGLPCPLCPGVVRNYFAVAHNAALALDTYLNGGADGSRARRKLAELLRATSNLQPMVDAHFAHHAHAHGPRESPATSDPPTKTTFHRGEPTTLVMSRQGCTCFMTLAHDGYGYSLCRDHEAERERLNKAALSGFHFGAGLSGGWIFATEPKAGNAQ